MFDLKPDYEDSQRRIDAFWDRELIDRPVVQFSLEKPPDERVPVPVSGHATPAERWLDADYQAELAWASLRNRELLGDTMPVAFPNLGPEVFSAFYGCPLFFGDYGTSWSAPILRDWAEVEQLRLDWQHPYLRKLHAMTDALLEIGRGHFITGMTDWHPGGDCLAALRDPRHLALDMIDHVAQVKALLNRIEDDYFKVYDLFYAKLRAAGQPIASWLALPCTGKFYIPSNDFSIMISTKMYGDVFLPGIVNECRFLDRSIYHLDGPKALRHLESLLAIPELTALQFVPGAGNEGFVKWVDVYRQAQAADKAIMVYCTPAEIERVIETLDPRGLYLHVDGVDSRATGEAILQRVLRWPAPKRP